MVDLENLLSETTDTPPCGPSLEYDQAFLELEQAAQGKPEQQFGETVIAAVEPDWASVRERALLLFPRTKDLRIAVLFTRAMVNCDGMEGLSAGLGLIHQMLERYWSQVHPQLDPDEDNDPTMRLNALAPLVDSGALLRDLRRSPFVRSRSLGQALVRDAEIALGKVPGPTEAAAYSLEQIESLVRAAAAEDMGPIQAVRDALRSAKGLHSFLIDKVGSDRATDMRPISGLLQALSQLCDRAIGVPVHAVPGTEGEAAAAGGNAPSSALKASGEVFSRDDALGLLDKVCDYLEKHEPSSPAPLLIRRAKRLMTMSFVDIIRDMTPESLTQIETIAGVKKE